MFRRLPLWLAILLLSFPQIVETIYSPALPSIAAAYHASPEQAAQTLSLWFISFGIGVVVWGRLSDLWGRRPALLSGLALYAIGAGWAMLAGGFAEVLLARLLSAFGAAVGSIVTQTALRDSYAGPELGRVFSILGMALAVSPAVGMFAGQEIAVLAGHTGVFAALGLFAAVLLTLSLRCWPETRPATAQAAPLVRTLGTMLRDRAIWGSAVLIASFNLAIFAYYQLGPFLFERLETRWLDFGRSGIALAAASVAGAFVNTALVRRGWTARRLTAIGILLLALGAAMVTLLTSGAAILFGMAMIAAAYAIAIPNILATALRAYTGQLGTAGAILSLIYYNLLGAGLAVAGLGQRLDLTLIACATLAIVALAIGEPQLRAQEPSRLRK